MTRQHERIDLEESRTTLQANLAQVVAKLGKLEAGATERTAREVALMEQVENVLAQIGSSIVEVARLLDAITVASDTDEVALDETVDILTLNEETVGILKQLFSPKDIQLIDGLQGEQRQQFIKLMQELWVKYSGPRGKSSTIQTDRFSAMYLDGLTIGQVARNDNNPRCIVADGLDRLVAVLSRGSAEERGAIVGRAHNTDPGSGTAPVPSVSILEQTVVPKPRVNLAASPKPATLQGRVESEVPQSPEKNTKNTPLTSNQLQEWVVNREAAISKALKGRYGRGDIAMHQAIDTLFSPVRTKFTPNQKEVIGNVLREIGVDSGQSFVDQARIMLNLPDKLRGYGFNDEHIKLFAMFVGLSMSITQGSVAILGMTAPRPLGMIMQESRNGRDLQLLDVQVALAQAMGRLLQGTAATHQGPDGILKT